MSTAAATAATAAPAAPAAPVIVEDAKHEFVMSGAITPEHITASGKEFKGYLCVNAACDAAIVAYVEGKGIPLAHVAFDVPKDLTAAKAAELHAAISALPKPVWVQCATANRASAAVAFHLSKVNGWSAEEAITHAKAAGYKFVGSEPLRNWLIRSLDAAKPADLAGAPMKGVIFRQLFEPVTSTYTYLLGDEATGEALLIDPVVEKADRDSHLIIDLGLTLKFAVNTHMHADHITGTHALKAKLGKGVVSVIAAAAGAAADLHVKEGDKLHFGSRYVTVIATPGHTNGCISFLMDDHSAVFTGDALFVRGCGRTDFQQGNSGALYDNLHAKIFTLPESTVVYPGHDYNGHLRSTVGEEKRYNPRLNKTRDEFIAIMAGLGLPAPKLLDVAIPANLRDGAPEPPAPAATAAAGGAAALPTA